MTEEEYKLFKEIPLILNHEISKDKIEFHETHISYLVMLPDYVYKIKKTIQLPFLDFSGLDMRKETCIQELLLNQRTAPTVYLDLLEVKNVQGSICIGDMQGVTIDYAVRMKRVDNAVEMDQMLKRSEVKNLHMEKLASLIAKFHQQTFAVRKIWDLEDLKATYNQLNEWSEFAGEVLGKDYQQIVEESCHLSDSFLEKNIDLMNERSQKGWVKDVHGDLHSHNIFLTNAPILFDCIEFDDELRQIDLLNELAFFMMDLEFYGADRLAQYFYKHYIHLMKDAGFEELEHTELLAYFKMYRASVRAKVSFISFDKHKEKEKRHSSLEEITAYLDLVKRYSKLLT